MNPEYWANLMLDLETLGTKPGSVILSIGAVFFDPLAGQIGPKFKRVIYPKSCTDAGLKMDPDTVLWWFNQSDEARKAITESTALPLILALKEFQTFCELHGPATGTKDLKVWGNGANFDNALLAAAYDAVRLLPPWRFSNDRCYRTVKNLHTDIPYPRSEVAHDCLIDAETQALHLMQILAKYPAT